MKDTASFDSAGAAWRAAVRTPDEKPTHKLALGGNLRISVRGLLHAVLKVTSVIVSVKQQVAAAIVDPLALLNLPGDVFSAGLAVLGSLYQKMPAQSYFTAVVLSQSEAPMDQQALLRAVTDLASQIVAGDSVHELPFYLFLSRKMAQKVIEEVQADQLKYALDWLKSNGFVEPSEGSFTFREQHFEWNVAKVEG